MQKGTIWNLASPEFRTALAANDQTAVEALKQKIAMTLTDFGMSFGLRGKMEMDEEIVEGLYDFILDAVREPSGAAQTKALSKQTEAYPELNRQTNEKRKGELEKTA